MHIHILGICGTFMGSLALLARELGHEVSGSDANVYPPMSTQLLEAGISISEGYEPAHLQPAPDLVVIGNAMSRGNAAVEYVLNLGLPYTSGPQWLCDEVLAGRWVLAVAGTHGKTTTSSMLAWILEYAGMAPGFLIGGVPQNFAVSARLGDTPFFVIEADEYDTAFFDKRSKFVHYRPRTLILNNLEFDHADIFPDLAAIERQFHHLVRTVPADGRILLNGAEEALQRVLQQGCWSEVESFAVAGDADWRLSSCEPDGSAFAVVAADGQKQTVTWDLLGQHNVANAMGALLAARHVGVTLDVGAAALSEFQSVKRRMELRGTENGVRVYDDFAHHPTAIATTLSGLAAQLSRTSSGRVLAVIEPRSNTMRMGNHAALLDAATESASRVWWYQPPQLNWQLEPYLQSEKHAIVRSIDTLVESVCEAVEPGDHVVVMSNGGFESIHEKLLAALRKIGN